MSRKGGMSMRGVALRGQGNGNNMADQVVPSQQAQARSLADTVDALHLYLLSRQAGWEGLVVEAFLEPTQLQGWWPQSATDLKLSLFAGGPLCMDQHYEDGPRTTLVVREGELVLRPGLDAPYEVSWKALTSTPTRTLHVHLSRDLLSRTAEELTNCDPTRLSLARRAGFQDALLTQLGLALWQELEQADPSGKLYAQSAAQMIAVHL